MPKFNFRVLPNAGGETVCYYLDVRRLSTNAVQATYGSSGSPLDCETGNVYSTVSTSIPVVADSDLANDLRIRVYASESNSKPWKVDMATVGGAIYGVPFTLYRVSYTDASTGTAGAAQVWAFNATDGTAYKSAATGRRAFSSTRYMRFYIPAYVPASAVITSVSLDHTYKSATGGDTTCWYAEIYNGASLIGTHGSSGSPISCNATTSYVADSVSLSEVDTTTEANNLVIKLFASVTGNRKSLTDLLRVRMTYSLASTGCVDTGVHTYTASSDSWIQQDSGGDDNFGTDTILQVLSNPTAKNRRALVAFDLPAVADRLLADGRNPAHVPQRNAGSAHDGHLPGQLLLDRGGRYLGHEADDHRLAGERQHGVGRHVDPVVGAVDGAGDDVRLELRLHDPGLGRGQRQQEAGRT